MLSTVAVEGIAASIATAGEAIPIAVKMIVVVSSAALSAGLGSFNAGGNTKQMVISTLVGGLMGLGIVGVGNAIPNGWTSTIAGSMAVGAALGMVTWAVQGGIQNLILGKPFGEGDASGAIGGFIGGAIGGAIGYAIRGKTQSTQSNERPGKSIKEQLAECNEEAGIFTNDGPDQNYGGGRGKWQEN